MTVMIDLEIDPDHSIIHGYRLVSDREMLRMIRSGNCVGAIKYGIFPFLKFQK